MSFVVFIVSRHSRVDEARVFNSNVCFLRAGKSIFGVDLWLVACWLGLKNVTWRRWRKTKNFQRKFKTQTIWASNAWTSSWFCSSTCWAGAAAACAASKAAASASASACSAWVAASASALNMSYSSCVNSVRLTVSPEPFCRVKKDKKNIEIFVHRKDTYFLCYLRHGTFDKFHNIQQGGILFAARCKSEAEKSDRNLDTCSMTGTLSPCDSTSFQRNLIANEMVYRSANWPRMEFTCFLKKHGKTEKMIGPFLKSLVVDSKKEVADADICCGRFAAWSDSATNIFG